MWSENLPPCLKRGLFFPVQTPDNESLTNKRTLHLNKLKPCQVLVTLCEVVSESGSPSSAADVEETRDVLCP